MKNLKINEISQYGNVKRLLAVVEKMNFGISFSLSHRTTNGTREKNKTREIYANTTINNWNDTFFCACNSNRVTVNK